MKKLILLIIMLISLTTFGQTNFKWEKIDSIPKTKDQIYSDTKVFIAEQWNSAKDVIQSDDKEGGIIVLKGLSQKNFAYAGATCNYTYSYIVKFMSKDGKVKIVIDNVHCQSVYFTGKEIPNMKIEPFDGDVCLDPVCGNQNSKFRNKVVIMMGELRAELQGIIDSYEKYIKTTSTTKDGW